MRFGIKHIAILVFVLTLFAVVAARNGVAFRDILFAAIFILALLSWLLLFGDR